MHSWRVRRRRNRRLEAPRRLQDPRVLGDDVAAAPVDELRQLAALGVKLIRRHVAQRLDRPEIAAEQAHALLARLTPQIVLAARMLMADPAVGDEKPQVRGYGDMARSEAAAIDQQRMPGDAAAGEILIHHAAAHADEIIFRPLADLGDRDWIEREIALSKQRVGDRDLERGRGAQARADGTSLQTMRSAPERLSPLISSMSATPMT